MDKDQIDDCEGLKPCELELPWKHSLRQVIAACAAHSIVIHAGINMAFSAILLPQLRDSNSSIQIDLDQGSWIASIVTAALPLGAFTIGPLMDRFGRKKMCIITTIPLICSWLLHCIATTVWYIYVGRIVAGFGAGLSTVGIVYVSEISHPKYRPMLLTFNSVFVTFGILTTCVLGFGLHWTVMSKIFLGFGLATLTVLFFIPESPYWLLVFRQDRSACANALHWLYPDQQVFKAQYARMLESVPQNDLSETTQLLKSNLNFYKKSIVWKPALILFFLFIIQQLTCAYVIIFYAVDIFKKIGGNFKNIGLIDAYVALILLGGIRFVMSIVLAVISKKVGRRILMFVSAIGMIVSSGTVGLYKVFTGQQSDGTVAVILVLCYICFSSFGWLVIPWTLIGELLPVKAKGVLGGLMVSGAYIMMFIILKVAPYMLEAVKLEYIFLTLSGINICGLIFLYLFLPETLGKTFQDIEKYFVNDN